MSDPGQFPEQRVGVFVDIQNQYYSARALHGKKVNFGAVLKAAVGKRQLVRAFAYGITTEEAHEGDFHDALTKQGFEVKTKPLQTFAGGQKKGDWDVGIAMDILRLEPKVDVIVLVSGDGDFVPLVEFSKERGLRFEVMSFRESTATALVEAVDAFTNLSEDQKTFLISDRSWSGTARKLAGRVSRAASPQRPPQRRTGRSSGATANRRPPKIVT